MKKLLFIILALLTSSTVYAKVGDLYFCEDTEGDLKYKSKYTIFWSPDGYIKKKYFETNKSVGLESRQKIVFQNGNSFISSKLTGNGIATTSFSENGNNIVSIRTFIKNDYAFSQKAKCFRQKIASQ